MTSVELLGYLVLISKGFNTIEQFCTMCGSLYMYGHSVIDRRRHYKEIAALRDLMSLVIGIDEEKFELICTVDYYIENEESRDALRSDLIERIQHISGNLHNLQTRIRRAELSSAFDALVASTSINEVCLFLEKFSEQIQSGDEAEMLVLLSLFSARLRHIRDAGARALQIVEATIVEIEDKVRSPISSPAHDEVKNGDL